ncbi:hypothetical protein [Cupriavidus gilardii]|uniref:Uncharacterized protein n=1 Tax=Cupriavidus gilardii TaxID=82541 RepID=A0A849BJ04_9BURK|nr:hypothetical protein [Cupriavidus gilardii]KAB0594627.1 hypothetical protein F7Q96_20670 [Cupriavidus gilardii]NNH12527.1 hypothetical protein [Cupriavidus gilardii]
MHYLLEQLKRGDSTVIQQFARAHDEWNEILRDVDAISVEELASRLTSAQYTFEEIFGDRAPGKDNMPWSGFSHLYSTAHGFDANLEAAKKLAAAFNASMCSGEVKAAALRAAAAYWLDDE